MRLGVVLVVALLVVPQEREKPSVEGEIDALIEKTNALESFRLVYEAQCPDDDELGTMRFEFTYRAPDQGRAHVSTEKGEMDCIVDDAQMVWRSDIEDGDGAWHRALYPEPLPASLVLDELFPPEELPLGPGTFLQMNIRDDPKTGRPAFDVSFGRATQGRRFVLGWLDNLSRRIGEVSVDDRSLALTGEHYKYRVSRSNGILEHVDADSDKCAFVLDLVECHLDEPLEEELVAQPEEAKTAAIDPEMTRNFEGLFGPGFLRQAAFSRVEGLLRTEERPWNELTRNDWRAFMDALHRKMILANHAEWLEEARTHTDGVAERKRAERDEGKPLAEIEKHVAESRAELEERTTRAETDYLDQLPSIHSKQHEPRQELFDVEKEVIAELWDELLREPALKDYDEKLEEALGK